MILRKNKLIDESIKNKIGKNNSFIKMRFPEYLASHSNPQHMKKYMDLKNIKTQ